MCWGHGLGLTDIVVGNAAHRRRLSCWGKASRAVDPDTGSDSATCNSHLVPKGDTEEFILVTTLDVWLSFAIFVAGVGTSEIGVLAIGPR